MVMMLARAGHISVWGYWCGNSGVYRWQMAHHFQFLAVPPNIFGHSRDDHE